MKIKNFLKIKKPYALSLEDWDVWNTKTKSKHPIEWFIFETIPDWYNINIGWPLRRFLVDGIYWRFLHTFIPKHQYHIIKPKTLKPGYHNEFDLIIHSSFHILTEFIQYEKSEGHVDWFATKGHKEFWLEANKLVYWWTEIRPNRDSWLDEDYPYPDGPIGSEDSWTLYNKYNNTQEYKNWIHISDIRIKIEKLFESDDEKNLIKLMKIRMYLWN